MLSTGNGLRTVAKWSMSEELLAKNFRWQSRKEQIDRVECRARDDDDGETSERELNGTVRCLRWKEEDRKSEGTAYFTTDRVVWSLQ